MTSCTWRQLDVDAFQASLSASTLYRPDAWSVLDVDGLVQLYNDEMTAALDRLIPIRTMRCRRRPSDPRFDDEFRTAKRHFRRLERTASAAQRTDDTDAAATATALWTAQRRSYRDLLRRKRESVWMAKVDAERSSSHQLCSSVDALLGRGRVTLSQDIGVTAFHRFFEAKVAGVRASTADAPPLSFTPAPTGCEFRVFRPITTTVVILAVKALPNKQCSSDPFPTRVLTNIDTLAPFLTELFNRSLSAGAIPTAFKAAYVTPLLKKSDLDPADVQSYRLIANLSVLSKLLERLVAPAASRSS